MIAHRLGFICSIYKLILDEGYVLTQRLNPIDTFRVCPASRLIPEHSACRNISILTRFTTWTSKTLVDLLPCPRSADARP